MTTNAIILCRDLCSAHLSGWARIETYLRELLITHDSFDVAPTFRGGRGLKRCSRIDGCMQLYWQM